MRREESRFFSKDLPKIIPKRRHLPNTWQESRFSCVSFREALAAIAWDSAGVTTGPMTVPVVLSSGLGLGKAAEVGEAFGILPGALGGAGEAGEEGPRRPQPRRPGETFGTTQKCGSIFFGSRWKHRKWNALDMDKMPI